MLNPAIGKLIKNSESRYKLVIDIAQRAREIAKEASDNGEIIIEKPVTLAMNAMSLELDAENAPEEEVAETEEIAE
jgi:DNA-directed RNA polymerase subunit omega